MIEVGKKQVLQVVRETEQGVYLSREKTNEEAILLPKNQVKEMVQIGDKLEVFVYRDSADRKIATTNKPLLTVGEIGLLKVVQITCIGIFLEWGLEKDLFMPFKEQEGKLKVGDRCLVSLYVDKSDRLCATMKIYPLLKVCPSYKVDEEVEGTIYSIKEAFGAFVAIENRYHGLIPLKEMYGELNVGDVIKARIKRINSEGKVELSLRKKAYLQVEEDIKVIMELLDRNQGRLNLSDKSPKEEINETLKMSKAAYKRAIGRLLKEGVIQIKETYIKRNW